MPEQLVYTGGTRRGNTGEVIGAAIGAFTGNPLAVLGAWGAETRPWPDVYADFEAGTVRVVGAQDVGLVGGRQYRTAAGLVQMLWGQQLLLQQAMTTGVVPAGLTAEYRALAGQLAGRVVDTRIANAQSQGQLTGALITSPGQSLEGGGIPVASWLNPAALAFQTPAARAIMQGAMARGPITRAARRKSAPRTRVRRKRRKASAPVQSARVRRRRGAGKLRKGSPEARRFMAKLRRMRGKRRSNS